jgi:mRNA interferase MazF
MSWAPERGDIVWITMEPTAGHEHSGRRPALVLSPGAYNEKVGLCIMCPVTSQVKEYPFEVAIPDGLAVAGVVLSDQAKSLDWRSRGAELACTVPADVTAEVLHKLGRLTAP